MERFFRYKLDHVIFWSATILFHMFTRAALLSKAGFAQFALEIIVRNALLAIIIYVNLGVLVPRLIAKKRYMLYALSLIGILAGYTLAKNAHDMYLYGYVLGKAGIDYFFSNSFYNLSIAMFYLAFSIALELSKQWYLQREQLRQIEVEKLNTELAYLKSQINPHFLFNSINTIYFQIDKQNTDARESLSRFSDMLRYQLYECNGHEVPIEREVEYLRNYVDLQRLRKDANYSITFRHDPDVKDFSIAPLLLISFVENAFKHVSHHPSDNIIEISLNRSNGQFNIGVFNTCETPAKDFDGCSGIGLKNVRRRLELLYPQAHDLKIEKGSGTFSVNLSIQLNGV